MRRRCRQQTRVMKHPLPQFRPRPAAVRLAAAFSLAFALAGGAAAQTAVSTNLPAVDPALFNRLLERIEQLERREADRTAKEKSAVEQATAPLLRRIGELEKRLVAVEGAPVLPEIAVTAEPAPSNAELVRKVDALERKTDAAADVAAAREKERPRLSVGASGVQFTSANTNFSLSLKGLVQADHYHLFDDNDLSQGNDGFVLRRVRLAAQGRFQRDFEYLIVPQYGGYNGEGVQILDATVAFKPSKALEIRVGKFKGPVGLELLQSINVLPFSERSLVSGLVPQRSVGVQVSTELWDGAVAAAAGLFNDSGDQRNAQNFNLTDQPEAAGRLFFQPFRGTELKPLKGLGFGVGGSFSQVSSNAAGLPATLRGNVPGYYTSPATQQFFAYDPLAGPVVADGTHWRLSPQGRWYWGPVGLLGEYALSSQRVYNSSTFRSDRLTHSAWHVTADWVLTGEPTGFGGIDPKRPFSWGSSGWGAWQLVGRFSQFDVDDRTFPAFANPAFSATAADSWSVGVNWWLNRNVRVLTSFTHTSFLGGGAAPNIAAPGSLIAPATVTAQDENVLASRFQISF